MHEINIGFIGFGNMGQDMCLALIRNSYKLKGINIVPTPVFWGRQNRWPGFILPPNNPYPFVSVHCH